MFWAIAQSAFFLVYYRDERFSAGDQCVRGSGGGGAVGAMAPPNISVGEQRSTNISHAGSILYIKNSQ